MAWAKGRQPSEFSAKREYQKQHPRAVCRVRRYGSDRLYAVFKDKDDKTPLLIRSNPIEAWEDALAGAKG